MSSLADAGTISLGGILLTGKLMGSDRTVGNQWNIGAFLILLIWCISHNIFVEMGPHYDQLAVGMNLSCTLSAQPVYSMTGLAKQGASSPFTPHDQMQG